MRPHQHTWTSKKKKKKIASEKKSNKPGSGKMSTLQVDIGNAFTNKEALHQAKKSFTANAELEANIAQFLELYNQDNKNDSNNKNNKNNSSNSNNSNNSNNGNNSSDSETKENDSGSKRKSKLFSYSARTTAVGNNSNGGSGSGGSSGGGGVKAETPEVIAKKKEKEFASVLGSGLAASSAVAEYESNFLFHSNTSATSQCFGSTSTAMSKTPTEVILSEEKFTSKEIFGDILYSDITPHEVITNDTIIQTSMEIDNRADSFSPRSQTMGGDNDIDSSTEVGLAINTPRRHSEEKEEKSTDADSGANFPTNTTKLSVKGNIKDKKKSKSKKDKKRKRTVFVSIKAKQLSNVDSVKQTVMKSFYWIFCAFCFFCLFWFFFVFIYSFTQNRKKKKTTYK